MDAALRLLDESGLASLSMRRLANTLGVQPSALYWHVADKQSLLAAVSERVLASARTTRPAHTPPPDTGDHSKSPEGPTPWEDALRAAATDLHQALLAHRDGAELVSSSLALGLVDLPLEEAIAAPLAESGASPRTTAVATETLTHLVLGRTFHEQQRQGATEVGIATGESAPTRTTFAEDVDLVVAGVAVLISMDTNTP